MKCTVGMAPPSWKICWYHSNSGDSAMLQECHSTGCPRGCSTLSFAMERHLLEDKRNVTKITLKYRWQSMTVKRGSALSAMHTPYVKLESRYQAKVWHNCSSKIFIKWNHAFNRGISIDTFVFHISTEHLMKKHPYSLFTLSCLFLFRSSKVVDKST